MDAKFWHERWQRNEIGFHQAAPHAALAHHWPTLGLAPGSRVFVPLAGKSLDMLAFAAAGHRVVGIELSALAVEAFFADNGLASAREAHGELVLHRSGDIELWCGDVFALTPALLGCIDAIFDRGALVALPPLLRQRYAAHLAGLAPPGCEMLLVTMEYEQSQMSGPPHAVLAAEVHALYGTRFDIALLGRDTNLADGPRFAQRGVTQLAEGYWRLRRRPDAIPAR